MLVRFGLSSGPASASMSGTPPSGRGRLVAAVGLALGFSLSACGDGTVERTEVVQLDNEGASELSEQMAACVRRNLDVDLPDDFLLIGERMPVDTDFLPPEAEQALAACFAEVNGASTSSQAPANTPEESTEPSVLVVDG